MKESQLQKQIIDYLSINANRYGFGHFAILNEAFMLAATGKISRETRYAMINHLKKMGMVPGMPDICILYRGQVYFVEVKSATGKLSSRQQKVHNWLNELDVPVEIVRSIEDVENFLINIGVIK